ncbi:hypothetical protein [Rubrolithibacter danxiaensis]|uniref:hypothetical protein n=1 Tax=Rubrolithibacter danxiaensis TaxID=3390805 RepID=UPI003BF7E93A
MKYLVIDAQLHGTGIRDHYEGGYIDPHTLALTDDIINRINEWLIKYEEEHYNSFEDEATINILDNEGLEIATKIKKQLHDAKIYYYSAARMTKVDV